MTTLDILQTLQNEVGPRRAGTAGEREAQAWIKARCEALGLAVELDEFTFIGHESYRLLMRLISLVWIGVIIWLTIVGQPLMGGIGFVAFYLYFNVLHKKIELRLAQTKSYNVVAGLKRPLSHYIDDPQKGTAVLLCAHYDTPRNFPAWFTSVRSLMRHLMPLSLLGFTLYGLFLLLWGISQLLRQVNITAGSSFLTNATPWIGTAAFVLAAPSFLFLLVSLVSHLISRQTDSPGTDDNGSGVALVLELARRFQENPPPHIDLFFAWWGAEERGLFGSRQFVRRFHHKLNKETFYIVNADCVGVGQYLTIQTGQGTMRRHPTHAEVIERLERAARKHQAQTVHTWESVLSGGSSDHAAWVQRGYKKSVALLRTNTRQLTFSAKLFAALWRLPDAQQLELDHIHTPDDTLSGIQAPLLAESTAVAETYIRDIEAAAA